MHPLPKTHSSQATSESRSWTKGVVGATHSNLVASRRLEVLARLISDLLPERGQVLDVGCGDGRLTRLIQSMRPELAMRGIDTLIRPETVIPVDVYDGLRIPFPDKSFDAVVFVDVLHHAENGAKLLQEAARVAKTSIIVKDHILKGILARPTLSFMDWVGNAPHGVALPYNYWHEEQWKSEFKKLRLTLAEWKSDLSLYPVPFCWLFDRQLHFTARLEVDPT